MAPLRLGPAPRRSLATQSNPGKPLGNAPLYLSLAGLAGLSYYVYMEYNETNAAATKKALPPVTSALTGDWIESPLKKVDLS